MKISIWQQFSSNHSANFIVIGRFEDAPTANRIVQQLRQRMHDILWGADRTTAENNLARMYDLDWYPNGIDWNGLPDDINEVVRQFDTDVFLMCPVETWDSHEPFFDLMKKMGSLKTLANSSGDGYSYGVLVDISCNAPSDAVAVTIYDAIKKAFDEQNKSAFEKVEIAMPWAKFNPDYFSSQNQIPFSEYDKLEKVLVDEQNNANQFFVENSVDEDGNRLNSLQIKQLWRKREEFFTQSSDLRRTIFSIRDDILPYEGEVKRDGTKIRITGFACYCIDLGVISLVRWLESLDCNDVTFEFRKREPS